MRKSGISLAVKRALDVLIAGLALLLTAPLLLFTCLWIYLTDRGSIFFRQVRIGHNGRPFEILKLRSMVPHEMQLDVQVRPGHELVTLPGRFARRFKVDELPQLINVLRGDMSLVGPRPTIREQVEQYTDFQRRRLEMLPGLTGWTQVNGGIEWTWDERIMLDVWYVDHWSLWLDLRILSRTMLVVLFGEQHHPRAMEAAKQHARILLDASGPRSVPSASPPQRA